LLSPKPPRGIWCGIPQIQLGRWALATDTLLVWKKRTAWWKEDFSKMNNLTDDQQKIVNDFKQLPKKKGRPPKEFGPLLKMAAAVLKDAGLSNADIAAELNISPATAAKIFRDKSIEIDVKDLEKVREGFSNNVAGIVAKMLSAANTEEYVEKLKSVKNPSLIIAITQMINTLNTLTGKPNAIFEVRDAAADISKKIREIEELEATIQKSMIKSEDPKAN
jgi:hypothetical protein